MKKLIWIIFGLIALGILIALSFPRVTNGSSVEYSVTHATQNQVKIALTSYIKEYGSLPTSPENYRLAEIFTKDNPRNIVFLDFSDYSLNQNKEIIDGWGTPMRFKFQENNSFSILSSGKDKLYGTKDDIKHEQRTMR